MSMRVEYVPSSCWVSFENELEAAENISIEAPEDRDVLFLGYDEVIAIPGTAEEIIAFAERIIATVKADVDEKGRAKR